MTTNDPCRGCWWDEGGRCFSEAFGPVPRADFALVLQGLARSGHEQTDAHLEACADKGARKGRGGVINRAVASLKAAGVKVEGVGTDAPSRTA